MNLKPYSANINEYASLIRKHKQEGANDHGTSSPRYS